jgi:hypothetical protein
MELPFTIEQFLDVFRKYNHAIFPLQIIFYLVALFTVYLAVNPNRTSNKIITAILSFFWLWMGFIYHINFFSDINKAAYFFGGAFILQGVLFFIFGVIQNKLSFKFHPDIFGFTGIVLIFYALVVYPILGYVFDHRYPSSPTFGLPCPTTIFTFGSLLFINKKVPVPILVIPLAWSVIGLSASLQLGVIEDIGLPVAGLLTVMLLLLGKRKFKLVGKAHQSQ